MLLLSISPDPPGGCSQTHRPVASEVTFLPLKAILTPPPPSQQPAPPAHGGHLSPVCASHCVLCTPRLFPHPAAVCGRSLFPHPVLLLNHRVSVVHVLGQVQTSVKVESGAKSTVRPRAVCSCPRTGQRTCQKHCPLTGLMTTRMETPSSPRCWLSVHHCRKEGEEQQCGLHPAESPQSTQRTL